MSAEGISARCDQATPRFNENSALHQQYIERDLALLIRSIIRKNVDKAVIDSFQAMSLASAIGKDALVVETILDLMVAEVRVLPNRETETLENLIPDDIRKHQYGLEDFICHQLQYMRKDRPGISASIQSKMHL